MGTVSSAPPGPVSRPVGRRVHSLDWLRMLALAGVFVFHTLRPFDSDYWHVKAAQQSELLTEVLTALGSWGLSFFFLVSGAGTYLALLWRSGGAYVRERVLRLGVPLVVVWLLLGPVQLWLEVHHHGLTDDSLPSVTWVFLSEPFERPPVVVGHSYVLWFIVYLLEFSLLGLPIFLWLRGPTGQRLMDRAGRLGERRGAVLLLFVPVALVTLPLAGDLFEEEHGWGQWAYFFGFFVMGHVLMTQPRLVAAVRRDVVPALALGAGGVAAVFALDAPGFFDTWEGQVWQWPAVLLLVLIAAQAWGWVLALWGLGMRAPAFQRPLPRVVADAAMPFFVLHQAVIVAVAYVVVQWDLSVPASWALVAVPSLVVAAAMAALVSVTPGVRRLLGVKPARRGSPTITASA